MKKIVWFSFVALNMVSCTDNFDYENPDPSLWWTDQQEVAERRAEIESTPPSATDTLLSETWNVTPEQIKLVDALLDEALCCDSIYIDLLLENETLVDSIESPTHQFCTECKIKALKFCYEHPLWGDTVGEWSLSDELKDILANKEDDFTQWWERIDWNY